MHFGGGSCSFEPGCWRKRVKSLKWFSPRVVQVYVNAFHIRDRRRFSQRWGGAVMLVSGEMELHPLYDMHLIGFQDGVNAAGVEKKTRARWKPWGRNHTAVEAHRPLTLLHPPLWPSIRKRLVGFRKLDLVWIWHRGDVREGGPERFWLPKFLG